MIVVEGDIQTLLERLKPVEHKKFQDKIQESSVIASCCYILDLGDERTALSRNQALIGEIFFDVATTFLSSYRKYLVPPKGGQHTLYDKFTHGPARSMVESIFVKSEYNVDPSCFANGKQITFYVALKQSFSGQALCVRALLNPISDGKPSNKGALLIRTVISA